MLAINQETLKAAIAQKRLIYMPEATYFGGDIATSRYLRTTQQTDRVNRAIGSFG